MDLICIQKSNLNSSFSFRIPKYSALRSDRTHFRSSMLSPDNPYAHRGIVIFVWQSLSFSKHSTSSLSLSLLNPYSDFARINISLTTPQRSLSSMFMFPYSLFFDDSFSPPFLPPPEISSFWRTSTAINSSKTQKVLLTPMERTYSIGSSPLTSFLSMTSTYLLFSIVPLAVTPLFTFYFDFHSPSAEEYLSLSSPAALFTSLALNAAKSSIPFGRIKRQPQAWWSAEVEEAVCERRTALAAAHKSHKDCQAYISASRHASSIITKAKAVAWQATRSSFSAKSERKFVYSLLRSVAGSSSSTLNFSNCSFQAVSLCLWRQPDIPLFCFPAKRLELQS